ncbi:MAG: hypothetical protein QME45_09975 [Clostridiales bacterium]|nr:hypothetical protein [Clostridiales bacterium]HBM80443.1 ABC transporter substrate-binding protein [Clostridiaceae bacterium]
MKRFARLISLIITLALVFSMVSCNSTKETTDKTPKNTEPLSFTATLNSWGGDDANSMVQKEWLKQMETKMGRKINIKFNYIPSSGYDEKVKLMISSNTLTDFVQLPSFWDYAPSAKQGLFLELSQYKNLMPNYLKWVNQAYDGKINAYMDDGKMYIFNEVGLPRFPADKGIDPNNVSSYRYDVFQKNNIKVPTTLDEVYSAGKQLKQLYPDKYPINLRFNNLNSLFYANHVTNDIYWDGEKYVFGLFQDGYKEALQFANKLYSERLLDPEYTIETNDTIKKKALNGDNFMWLNEWFTSPGDYTRNAGDGKIFAITLYPDNPKYGKAWQSIQDVNTVSLNIGWDGFVINPKTKDPEGLIKFCDLQYSEDIIRLITWGIEGTTYTIGSDGKPHFVDSIKKAADPWAEGDKYGIRASSKHRPGLQMAADSAAYVDFAPNDYIVVDNQLKEEPIEKSSFFLNIPFPKSEYTPPFFRGPSLQFTQDESQQISTIMTPIYTYRDEMQSKFVKGDESFDKWGAYQDKLKKMGDIDKVLKIYNDAAKRYNDKKAASK